MNAPASSSPLPAVGVIGLGAMGRGMAASLRRACFPLFVHDVRPEADRTAWLAM